MDKLIQKYLEGNLSNKEVASLYKWVTKNENNLEYFKNKIFEFGFEDDSLALFEEELSLRKLKKRIQHGEIPTKKSFIPGYLKYAAAIVLLFSLGYWFLDSQRSTENIMNSSSVVDTNEAEPTKIILKLPDGSVKTFNHQEEGYSLLNKTVLNKVNKFGELIVPRGEVFKIILSDSTTVWLNSESKLRFPENFNVVSDNRTVFLEGEAFFDVTHNEKKPFIVKTSSINVNVLGTKFNVSSYTNESVVHTTLVQGSVSVDQKDNLQNSILISPNQQAQFNKNSDILSSQIVNTDHYTAWLQKRIVFRNMPFKDIIEKIERVYDVEIINQNKSLNLEHFTGEFDKDKIETIFKALSTSINFNYEINEKQITIKNK